MKNPINNGTNPNNVIANIPDVNICHAKLDIIANNKCPAIIFAPNLNPNIIPFATCEINSINTKNHDIPNGAPFGINIDKKFNL
jgi:hypothetical protein